VNAVRTNRNYTTKVMAGPHPGPTAYVIILLQFDVTPLHEHNDKILDLNHKDSYQDIYDCHEFPLNGKFSDTS